MQQGLLLADNFPELVRGHAVTGDRVRLVNCDFRRLKGRTVHSFEAHEVSGAVDHGDADAHTQFRGLYDCGVDGNPR
jgi:hypothetical protein